jgi:amino acid adenylation domain-containing protein
MVQDFLQISAARLPTKVALVCGGQRLTYAEIDAAANRLANALIDHGVHRGDRVAIFLNSSSEGVIALFATLKAGAVFVPINHSTKLEKLVHILNNCAATALVIDGQKLPMVATVSARVPSLRFGVVTGPGLADSERPQIELLDFASIQECYGSDLPPQVHLDLDLAGIIYTSGTVGEPKGVMIEHGNVVFVATSVMTYLQLSENDVILNVLPLSFSYGLYQLLMTFKAGGRLVLEPSFAFLADVLKRVESERITGLPGVPTMFATLLHADLSAFDLSSLRFMTNAAAALPPDHVLALRRKFPTARLYCMYGQTETKRTLYLPPEQADVRPGSVGFAIPGTEVWLEDEAGNRLGPGQTGELVVRGRHVMRGYWEAPEETARRLRPGPTPGERVCYSGDLFTMDEEGYFYFVARKDDIIKSRGEKVAPNEVEKVLYGLAGVVEAAVVGVPDPILGQVVKAFIVPNGLPLTRHAVLAHCKAYLEDFMVPKLVEFRTELPHTASGKIKKRELAQGLPRQ